ncbi:MAG: MATE family efflux transporter [Gemmatimonadota bacterium]|nr:MATE family efflux transporter [Gemmatimonadota bacterium]MDQ8177836.1 MATE family efflux transporter [Gemmatimonadota bacterium]
MRFAQLRPTSTELREMLRLAAPIVAVNVGMMFMGVVDSLMLGRVSGAALAAGVLGNFIFYLCASFGLGFLLAIDPVVAQAIGAGDAREAALGVQRGVVLAIATSIVMAILLWPAPKVLTLLGQPADVAPDAGAFVRWSIPGVFPFFLFALSRQALQAHGSVAPVLWAAVVGNVVNVLANLVLVFGMFGVPALGVVGSAISTTIARWVMLGAILLFARQRLRRLVRPWFPEALAWAPLRGLAALGAPIGLQFFAEVNAFGLVTIMMGWVGTNALAGHEIALNLASLTFMVPLGVAAAGTVMVGRAIGRGDPAAARRDAVAALVVGIGFMSITAVAFLVVPGLFARGYTTDGGVITVAVALIPIAGIFQVFDGMQVCATGVLRGAGDTRVPMAIHMASFWLVGLPLGSWLCFGLDGGPAALWWGLTAGLAAAGLFQLARVRSRFGGPLERLRLS